jgi:hypothetical protein
MPVETLTYTYTSQDEISRLISIAGTNLRISDLTSTMKTEYWVELIAEATDVINQYCIWKYDAADMADNRWVRSRATWIALVLLCRRRGNDVPKSVLARYNEIMEELQKVHDYLLEIPRLNTSSENTPSMSNIHVDPRYTSRKIRVNPNISVGSLSAQQDLSYQYAYDWF